MKNFIKHLIALFVLTAACSANAQQTLNTTAQPFASQTFTAATVNSSSFINTANRGGHFIVNVSSYTSGSVTVHVQGYSVVAQQWYDILVSTAISSTGVTVLKVYPGIGASANAASPDILPYTWRIQLVGASTPNMILSVDANLEL